MIWYVFLIAMFGTWFFIAGFFLIKTELGIRRKAAILRDLEAKNRAIHDKRHRTYHYDEYYEPEDVEPVHIIDETEDWVHCPSCERLVERVDEHLNITDRASWVNEYPWSCKPKKVKTGGKKLTA